jgi:uncharacterized membrane protein
MNLEVSLICVAIGVALLLRPWRMLANADLLSPMMGALVVLPWIWAIPRLQTMPLPLQLSGACAVTLMLGWPLAVLVLTAVAVFGGLIAYADFDVLVSQLFWHGVLPATFALCAGAAIRRVAGSGVFVYILGRAFAATIVCTFAADVLAQFAGYQIANIGHGLSMVGHWLLAWGDGFMTGMTAAIFVAYRPQWLATWSDSLANVTSSKRH